ncbi:electron transfer flavoprotein subunit alpha/FixB family protein [Raineyella fluvialis]|uniref:Electron transfer flavoprotein alpha subunit apoprotein n=1 Tax=Raineyella fluvialis TaxID=2662261 RepID=A0A5Q2F6X0_9ACTN|nr:electron transfer flavoprotein subunit alpha/FixB family protein [Raineyella fluvialis]QGF22418.1 hypothetical protein Rai3103_00530 [Raineyella fluvialis]
MRIDAWLVVAEDCAPESLLEAARRLGGVVSAVVVGTSDLARRVARTADRVEWFPTTPEIPAEAWSIAVADLLATEGARVTLAGNGPTSRTVLGAVAARLRAPLLAPVVDVSATREGVVATRLVYGGIAVEHDEAAGPACLVVEGSTPRSAETDDVLGEVHGPADVHGPVEVHRVEATPLAISCSVNAPPDRIERDLASADRVIGVGRGLGDPAFLTDVERLAEALGAQVACSRPVAEDLGWLPRDRYLGVSGRRIAPRLYLMLGISGEIQHMIGVRDAGLIVAVNSDVRAPVVSGADITVVGDLHAVVPALLRQLTTSSRKEPQPCVASS